MYFISYMVTITSYLCDEDIYCDIFANSFFVLIFYSFIQFRNRIIMFINFIQATIKYIFKNTLKVNIKSPVINYKI